MALLGLGEHDRDEILYEANRLFAKGKIEDAAKVFGLALDFFPDAAEPWIGIGACHQSGGWIPLAMWSYEMALKARPGDPFALANLAECALLLGDREAAREALSGITRAGLAADLAMRIERLQSLVETPDPPRVCDPDAAVAYAVEMSLSEAEFRSVLGRSGLAERRPIDEPGAIRGMLASASLLVTARAGGKLVGVSRALSDQSYCTYLSDLAVDREFQRRGIGRELIRRTHEAAGRHTTLILLAAPLARDYYPHIGMIPHDSCWIIPRTVPPDAVTGGLPSRTDGHRIGEDDPRPLEV